jgi:hypothetical protein
MSRLLAPVAFLLAIASAAPAGAQPAPWEAERLTAGWVFTPAGVFGTMWDSNATLQNEDSPQVSTLVGTLSPRGEINYNGRRTFFNAGYAGTLQAFRQVSELNRYEQRTRAELRHQLSRRAEWRASANLTAAPTTDQLTITPGAIPFLEVGARTFEAGTGVTTRLAARTTLDGSYTFSDVRFDDDENTGAALYGLSGGYAHNPAFVLTYDLTNRLSVGGAWDYVHGRIQAAVQPFDVHTVLGQAGYQLHQYTKVTGAGGISHIREPFRSQASSGLALRGGLEQQIRRATILTVQYARHYVPSYHAFGGVDPTHSFTAGARVNALQNRLGVSGSVSYGRSESILAPGDPLGSAFELEATSIGASVAYQFVRWLRGEVFWNGLLQRTNVQGNMDRSRIGVQFVTLRPVRMD